MKRFHAGMWVIVGAVVVLGLLAVPSHAANILLNGSFESALTSWTLGGTAGDGYPVVVIETPGSPPYAYPTGAFGEAVPADTISGGSPDAAGTHAAYFVSDFSNETLTQIINLTAGTYEVGFDIYYPLNGFNNSFDATFKGEILNVALVNTNVQSGTAQTWQHFSTTVFVPADVYNAVFSFTTSGFPAADVVVDRVYVVSQVPEPGTLLLLGSGLLGLAITGARKKFRK